ncbi:unnamed protein product [Leptidea sinapis]|uniref:Acetyl-CoA acetyltransferase n=1 Tax=Leptidea sinapis TaxID=189913 RepID=A0A5E4QNU6_9NEOP|nr:unnamed protein product [Leptidea sinapis]
MEFKSVSINEVVIVSAVRTPIGSFGGALSSLSATKLGAIAVEAAVERAGIPKEEIKEVCSSGMKAVIFAIQTLQVGAHDVVLAGGMESMSNIPFYLKRGKIPYGGTALLDGILQDGLTDVYNQYHMGDCAENAVKKFNFSREEQDEHAMNSYRKTAAAYEANVFFKELVAVSVPQKKGPPILVTEDEEYKNIDFEKFTKLSPAFQKDGTITAGNSSPLNDGGAAVVLMTAEAANRTKTKPLARVIGYADGERDPIDFTLAPAVAITNLLEKTGVNKHDIALWEINEPFSMVTMANQRLLGIDPAKINIHGSAVSMGHPIGMSGTRLIAHLCHVLNKGELGVATTCNGGGGASCIMIEKL